MPLSGKSTLADFLKKHISLEMMTAVAALSTESIRHVFCKYTSKSEDPIAYSPFYDLLNDD